MRILQIFSIIIAPDPLPNSSWRFSAWSNERWARLRCCRALNPDIKSLMDALYISCLLCTAFFMILIYNIPCDTHFKETFWSQRYIFSEQHRLTTTLLQWFIIQHSIIWCVIWHSIRHRFWHWLALCMYCTVNIIQHHEKSSCFCSQKLVGQQIINKRCCSFLGL